MKKNFLSGKKRKNLDSKLEKRGVEEDYEGRSILVGHKRKRTSMMGGPGSSLR